MTADASRVDPRRTPVNRDDELIARPLDADVTNTTADLDLVLRYRTPSARACAAQRPGAAAAVATDAAGVVAV